ncbi:MAG: hypothetical protein AVDCRST_MAG93-6089, partial [uncultured Chloroflexia bacterium]
DLGQQQDRSRDVPQSHAQFQPYAYAAYHRKTTRQAARCAAAWRV